MKHKTISCSAARAPLFPNAADSNYFAEKALEILAALLTGIGTVYAMLFLLTMA